MTAIISRQTRAGKLLTIAVEDERFGGPRLRVTHDGKPVEIGIAWVKPLTPDHRNYKEMTAAGATHVLGPVALFAGEAELIAAAVAAARAVSPWALREDREAIRQRISSALDLSVTEYNEAIADDDLAKARRRRQEGEAMEREARAELAAFDAAHPEIKEQLERERGEAVERNRWN